MHLNNHYTESQLRDLAGGDEIQHSLIKSPRPPRPLGGTADELPTESERGKALCDACTILIIYNLLQHITYLTIKWWGRTPHSTQ